MDSAKPSLDLVRSVTDEHVLRTLMRHRRLTRAELATEIGISKPTAGESVRRLTERGLLADTGERTPGGRGRGRVGSYYALAPAVGAALAVTIAAEGVVAERLNVYGDTVARASRQIDRPARPDQIAAALLAVATELRDSAGQLVRVAVVSAADPVDRASGRLVHLPDSPFLVGDLDPVAVLAPFVDGAVVVDNDVNWAALAERDSAGAAGLRDFAYLYLGEGLGCAIVNDGEIRRGRTGLTGEIAHLITIGPGGRATRFIELFGELGLRHAGTTAIDVERLLTTADRAALGAAVGGVIAALIALADPQEVVIGGSWGPALLGDIRDAATWAPRDVTVRAAGLTGTPVLAGVRAAALDRLRGSIVGR
ncbi:ROK family transcriptional regulator [Actinoplanes awajinensis]|uniref:ArsR family transcriptional regulator n=1 Tax=Actinoplanes awajinensis subsp. mycoplanecinus TaxID=135947 RepID=A0A0X3V8I5_9ACTN|nr:ROK family transcriptional regulator [Actinoplanes awajinensis]KUL41101.1 ArsR family transcriptional regulator [Actinoplanes awajinensis subsp. mycoplanecinus]